MFKSLVLRSSRQVANHANHIARQGEHIDPKAAVAVMKKTQKVKETLKRGEEDAKRVSAEEKFSGNVSEQIKGGTAPSTSSADPKDEMWSPLRSNKP
ncbi:hypothetical protein K493DRAFT_320033 [Basidiobolus meristosporus CBS 931.73]|uniref:Uncharacterized protein n=1 Tax=Basidiobolus meristosporus CBS 931.73 TaxID=1314790 RepID=A0A1Y1XGU2_9FUNG|nr:hypothetical protein K493DRAFT_320033 [Basidiobolus meristosporus CBS 931.73]|eukprot:ORX84979.1 hypothetical protein K493DRAFT_320033 [Basidiobolus meristosporus CBS 931.73]